MERIVIGVDGSESAQAAIEEGLELARVAGADVTFVLATETASPLVSDGYYEREFELERKEAHSIMQAATAEADRVGVNSDYEICHGDPADAITRVALYRDADLVVVGSRGLGPVREAVLGSVSRAVVRRSPLPVLVAKQRVPAKV